MNSKILEGSLHAALCEAVDDGFESRQVPWLARLVEQPSYTLAPEDVEAAAALLDEEAARVGLSCARIASRDPRFADHRVYTTAGTAADDMSLALVGHMDTVFPRSMGFLRFERDGDFARGPGVLDMKGGLSVALFALAALQEVVPACPKLRLICVSDEEVGSPSSSRLFEALAPRLEGALVFEAGRDGDRIITARKGGGTFTLKVTGRAAHSGNDHASGINAIHALALVIPRIEALTSYPDGVTVNVGLISGGTAKNTVPDEANCSIDARFCTQQGADALLAHLNAIVSDPWNGELVPERLRGARFELEGHVSRPPMEATEASQALRRRYEAFAASVGLEIGEAPRIGGGSDANLLAAWGVPCIDGLGPYGEGFHHRSEWCSLESLRRRTQALACFLAGIQDDGRRLLT